MWYLNKNVYLVNGYKNGAIYDLNSKKLFSISSEAKELLNKVLNNDISQLTQTEENFLNSMCKQGILTREYTEYHVITELKEKNEIEFAWIEVTTKCNLKCVHCYDESSCNQTKVMSYTKFCKVIDELEHFGIRKIQIIGGEPFILGETLIKYLKYIEGKFDYVEIFTNGTLINDEWLEYLKSNDINIALSVYSYIENEHDKITKSSGSWKKTNKTIQKLKDYGIKYKVKNVLMSNLDIGDKYNELYVLSKKRDIVRIVGRANIGLLSKDLLKRKLITKKSMMIPLDEKFIRKTISGHNCFSRRLYISADMELYPCVMERRLSHGNLSKNNLDNLIDENLLTFNKDKIDGCKDCEYRYNCFDCRPDSYNSGVKSKPWYCTYNPKLGMWENEDKFIENIFNDYK